MSDTASNIFERERPRLLRLAYRYLGTISDAEDIVQDAWIKFSKVENVENPASLLSTIVTRLALDRLKSASHTRTTYIGPWLPEPYVEARSEAQDAALDISFAVMRSLENLTPQERAAFFLRELFDVEYGEIADTLETSQVNCRKLVQRARSHLRAERPRFVPSSSAVTKFVTAFRETLQTNDVDQFKSFLAQDVEFISDGGGKISAARNIVRGTDAVSALLMGLGRSTLLNQNTHIQGTTLNGVPGLLLFIDGELDSTFAFDLTETGEIATFYLVRNPEKLTHLPQSPD